MQKNRFYNPRSTALTVEDIAAVRYAAGSLPDIAGDGDATIGTTVVNGVNGVNGVDDATAHDVLTFAMPATQIVAAADGAKNLRMDLLVAPAAKNASDPLDGTSVVDGGDAAHSAAVPNGIKLEDLLNVRNSVMQRQEKVAARRG